MTRKTLKGGIGMAIVKAPITLTGKVLKKSRKAIVGNRAILSALNTKTFMGQNMSVHAYSFIKLANKVFDFAKKYEKYGKSCKDEKKECLTTEEIKQDRDELIEQILNELPETYNEIYIKDPRRINFVRDTNKNQIFRKEDLKFLYRLMMMLEAWSQYYDKNENYDTLMNRLNTQYPFIMKFIDTPTTSIGSSMLGMGTIYSKIFTLESKQIDVWTNFKYDKLTKKDIKTEFDALYKEQYLNVIKVSEDRKTLEEERAIKRKEQDDKDLKDYDRQQQGIVQGPQGPQIQGQQQQGIVQGSEGSLQIQQQPIQQIPSEVQPYIDGIPTLKKDGIFIGNRYTLKRKDKIISIELNP